MRLKFIDSKNRIRSVICDYTPKRTLEDLCGYAVEEFGPIVYEKLNEFAHSRFSEEEIKFYKERISIKTGISVDKIKDEEILTLETKTFGAYLRWLDTTYPNNPDRTLFVDFYWSEHFVRLTNNHSYNKKNPRKAYPYKALKHNFFTKLNIDDGDSAQTDQYGNTEVTLVGERKNFDKLAEEICNIWNSNLSVGIMKSPGVYLYNEVTYAETEALRNSDEEEDKEELEILENPSKYTVEEVKRVCYKKVENAPFFVRPNPPLTAKDSKDWCNIKGIKFAFNFEDSKLYRGNEGFDYFTANKELERKYYDSKSNVSYEKWLTANPQVVNDTLDKMSKGGKTMNDSLKNLKFRFKDGIEIEVLDSEGKSFAEVKDEAIQVHRQMLKKDSTDSVESEDEQETKKTLEEYGAKPTNGVNDDEKETAKVLEKYGAEPTNDSLAGIGLSVREYKSAEDAIKAGISKESWVEKRLSEGTPFNNKQLNEIFDEVEKITSENKPVEDSVEKTTNDKYQVIVNGKEIGIYDTYEEAEEAEKKALEAIEKGIPKVEMEDCGTTVNDDAEQTAYENAKECLTYGVSKNDWDSCGLPQEKADEIWKRAFKDLAQEM